MSPAEELRYLILAAQREGSRTMAEALRPLDLTPSQAEVLRVLQDYQPLSLIELGNMLICENGSPSRLVDGLVKTELVERIGSPTDKRKVTLSLTKAGQDKASAVGAIETRFHADIANLADEQTLKTLREALRRYVEGTNSGIALALRSSKD